MKKEQKELIKKIAVRFDELIKFKSNLIEMFDGKVFQFLLQILFEKFWEKIPVDLQDEVTILLEAFADNNLDQVPDAVASAINDRLDLPGISESDEEIWIALNIEIILKFIIKLKDKK